MALKIAGNTVVDDDLKAYVDGVDLSAISSSIADTAVDVFVYDTRKDSDGGAWRKRTQHTSWYNETLNTSTRGARREFPAVAVIVAESNQVTIYDGDDPDLPMWMVCNTNSSNYWIRDGGTVRSLSAYNGILLVGANGGGISSSLLSRMDLLKDRLERHFDGGVHQVGISNVAERHTMFSTLYDGGQNIISRYCNDVAMTVLPNAPIDPATQLPIPTIAVATDGGVSVIKDDGSVVDITHPSYNLIDSVFFTPKNELGYTCDSSLNGRWMHIDHTLPSSDVTKPAGYLGTSSDEMYHCVNGNSYFGESMKVAIENFRSGVVVSDSGVFSGTNSTPSGLVVIERNPTSPKAGMTCEITSEYNTGWMVGGADGRNGGSGYANGALLATLSDTDDTDVTGSELVTNGTFDTDTSGWTNYDAARGTISVVSGKLRCDNSSGTGNTFAWQAVTVVAGNTYTLTAEASGTDGTYLGAGNSSSTSDYGVAQTAGNPTLTFTATSTTVYVQCLALGTAGYVDYDNVTMRLAEEDRSVNGNGLQVFGTVTKTPVATGADLVAYSGFGSANHLVQPYNSDLDFGTDDFCYMAWVKATGSGDVIFDRFSGSGNRLVVYCTSGQLRLGNGTETVSDTSGTITDGNWKHVLVKRSSGVGYIYVNGQLRASGAFASSVTTTTPLVIGEYYTLIGNGAIDAIALFRASATAPTAEQIAKIYEDEKYLFQEGAQATLYGSSDAVTALAYDDTTDLLHVGTSAGRSDFSGLRRVSNTTDAVGTAISASNGMIVEE